MEKSQIKNLEPNSLKRRYTHSLKIPVFGEIPLLPKEILRDLKLKNNPPLWAQFFKYGIFGVMALCILIAFVAGVQHFWPDYLDRDKLDKATMQLHMSIVLAAAFIPSNLFSYLTNRFFVFTPGKHSLKKELGIFTMISLVSFVGGELGNRLMIDQGYNAIAATISFAMVAALVNFVARKIVVFED